MLNSEAFFIVHGFMSIIASLRINANAKSFPYLRSMCGSILINDSNNNGLNLESLTYGSFM